MRTRPFLFGWLAGLATVGALAAAAGAFALLGGFETSATTQHSAPVARLLHATMRANVSARAADIRPPAPADAAHILSGAGLYETRCLSCHGAPGVGRARWASALVPTPPYLLDASRRWDRAELYTIVHDGVKMTAMPAWGEIHSDADIWDIVALLEAMPRLTPGQFARLRANALKPVPGSEARAAPPAAPARARARRRHF